jgi:FkbM family methyltransferase
MAFVLHFLRPGDLFVDVGANVGFYSILAAAASGANCLAFEPGPDAFDWLCGNIGLNGVSARVEVRREALGRQAGQVAFTVGQDTVNHVVLAQNPSKKTQIVPVTTLDRRLVRDVLP